MKKTLLAVLLLFPLAARAQQQPLPPLRIQEEGSNLPIRFKLNCVGAGITCSDDSSNHRTLITIASAAGTVTNITMGTGLSSTQSPLTTTGTMSIDQTFSPTWTGTHTFNTHTVTVGGVGGGLALSPTATTGTPTRDFTDTMPAHTALTASAEFTPYLIDLSATLQFATGALANERLMYLKAPTLTAVGASTITTAATLAINGAPTCNSNATCTNTYALSVEAGKSKFAGDIVFNADDTQNVGSSTIKAATVWTAIVSSKNEPLYLTTNTGASSVLIRPTATGTTDGFDIFPNLLRPSADLVEVLGDATHRFKRFFTHGTAAVSGDFAASAGFGSTASFGTITGDDTHARFTVTASGISQAANPTITYTFHDGTWTNAPFCLVHFENTNDTVLDTVQATQSSSATALTITYNGTPVVNDTYTFAFICIGG